jgi:ATP-dependent helicase/nuclease subunit A
MPGKQAGHCQSSAEERLMRATADQQAAIQTEGRALLVDAGAGTGKTRVLVERFIHLLEEHPDWPLESIIAITFTNKATREMRSRIRQSVEDRAEAAPPESHWHARRRMVDRLMVSTIHGLCAHILRENAIAAGVDPLFQALDEVEAGVIKEEAINQTIAELVDQASPCLDLLVSLKVRDLKNEMAQLLEQRGMVHRIMEDLLDAGSLLEGWAKGLEQMRWGLWQAQLRLDPYLEQALDYFDNLPVLDPTDLLAAGVVLARQGVRSFRDGDLVGAIQHWQVISLKGGRRDNWGGAEALDEIKAMLKALQASAKKLETAGCTTSLNEQDERAAAALQLWKDLWLHLEKSYNRLKQARQALDFDDLEILTEALLQASPCSERLQAFLDGIQHLMVDEFQDTNQVQQSIVYALAHPQDNGKLFVVGDAKQSIYRFRQAQVAVFNRTAQDIANASGQPAIPLRCSFRTQSDLVSALNALFERIFTPGGEDFVDYEARPGALEAQRTSPIRQEAAPASVEVTLLPKQDNLGNKINSEGARIWEARRIAQRLQALERDGFQVWDKEQHNYRTFRMGDAAVLFRSTTDLPLYEEQFKALGLPYLTVSGRGYYDRPEVQDLAALLASLYSPGDDLNLATALRSPIFGLSDETLYRLRWRTPANEQAEQPIPYMKALVAPPPTDQPGEVARAGAVFDELRAMTGRVPVWNLLRTALDLSGYETSLSLMDAGLGSGSRLRGNLLKFMEIAREWGGASLSGFLRQVQDLRAREAREGEALGSAPDTGAVQLMSIHAAKGLEFPVVVVADLGRSKRPPVSGSHILHDPAFGMACKQRNADGEWVKTAGYRWAEWLNLQMEEAENKRLLYVACTRAADLLLLSGYLAGRNCWLQDILGAWDLPPEGAEDELESRPGYSIRMLRPVEQPAIQDGGSVPPAEGAGLEVVPALAGHLPKSGAQGLVSVTHLARLLADEGHAFPELRPVVYRVSAQARPARAPAYLIGRVVHRQLADWSSLALPEVELQRQLQATAQREGLTDTRLVTEAGRQAWRMIDHLHQDGLYDEINRAVKRYSELPFNLNTPLGMVEGVIDLLYQGQDGAWHLIDWKTEWVDEEQIQEPGTEFLTQLALYAHAVQVTLGVNAQASLAYLSPRLRRRPVEGEVLAKVFEKLWVMMV